MAGKNVVKKDRAINVAQTDIFPPEKRSQIMSKIRGKNTKPELAIKHILDSMGVKYVYQARLFGRRVDFFVPDKKLVIEYRSCFWHNCPLHCRPVKGGMLGAEFWRQKLERNRKKDEELEKILETNGYKLLVIWDHDKKKLWELVEGAINA